MLVLLKCTYISDLIIFLLDILNMKLDFVYGVLQAIQGERNPINLLFLFKWLKEFLMDIPLHHLTEDMFDVLACYFPVDFRAPSNENVTFYCLLIVLSCCNICFSEYNKRRFGRCFVSMFVCQSRFWGILHFFGSGKIGFFFRNCQTGQFKVVGRYTFNKNNLFLNIYKLISSMLKGKIVRKVFS